MRKVVALFGLIVGLAIPATALAVNLHGPHVGTGCSGGGTFHFVANKVDGGVGTLTVNFSGAGDVTNMAPTHVTQGTNHWTLDASGTIISASATVGEKLVLSDVDCDDKKSKK